MQLHNKTYSEFAENIVIPGEAPNLMVINVSI